MKKILIYTITSIIIYFNPGIAVDTHIASYPSEIEPIIEKIEKLPEIRALIYHVQSNGPIHIEVRDLPEFAFEAMWDGKTRTIVINKRFAKNEGHLICSIIFELHNAETERTLQSLITEAMTCQISKETYVWNVEKIEHQNALATCQLIEQGIEQGLFPLSTRWNIEKDFEAHLLIQQQSGHSDWNANYYDRLVG